MASTTDSPQLPGPVPKPFWTTYPTKPAAECPSFAVPLERSLLRIVPGCARGRVQPVTLGASANAISSGSLLIRLTQTPQNTPSVVVTLPVGADGAVRPDVWADFVGDGQEDFCLKVELLRSTQNVDSGAALLGSGHVDASTFAGKKGTVTCSMTRETTSAPISSDYVAEFAAEYLLATPFCCASSYCACPDAGRAMAAKRQTTNAMPHIVGHRGVGSAKTTSVPENTLMSFALATETPLVSHVELDIQLSKDDVPVIFHDWAYKPSAEISHFIRNIPSEQFTRLPPQPLRNCLDNLAPGTAGGTVPMAPAHPKGASRSLVESLTPRSSDIDEPCCATRNVRVRTNMTPKNISGCVESEEADAPYLSPIEDVDDSEGEQGSERDKRLRGDRLPTLIDVCTQLDPNVGLLLEVKYPPPNVQARLGVPYAEHNLLVDRILHSILCESKWGGLNADADASTRRSIRFLSFDPDVCLLLSLKQTVFPVFLLHCELRDGGARSCDDADPRTMFIDNGVAYAYAHRFAGLVLFSEIALDENGEELLQHITREKGMSVLTYGKENQVSDLVLRQYDIGVQGVIADQVLRVAREVTAKGDGTPTTELRKV